jgi:hypothetical protein
MRKKRKEGVISVCLDDELLRVKEIIIKSSRVASGKNRLFLAVTECRLATLTEASLSNTSQIYRWLHR